MVYVVNDNFAGFLFRCKAMNNKISNSVQFEHFPAAGSALHYPWLALARLAPLTHLPPAPPHSPGCTA